MCEVLSSKVVKTRKPHKCWGCVRVIPIGTEVLRVVSIDMGISSAYWCADCEKVIDERHDGEACYSQGDLREDLIEDGVDLTLPMITA